MQVLVILPLWPLFMPVIRITSLPFENQDSSHWPAKVCENFAQITQIPLEHVSTTWQLLPGKHYAYGGKTCAYQPRDSHPLITDIMLPDFYSMEHIELIIQAAVEAISTVANMPKQNIFVQVNRARSGAVYDEGRIVRW